MRTTILLLAFLAYPPFSAAHSMPPSLWAIMLMPRCEHNLDGFSARAKAPYAAWRQKHSQEVGEFELQEPTLVNVPLQDAQRHQLEAECEKVLNYMRDDVRSPDPRFATPKDTWQVFVTALRSGNKTVLAECFSSDSRDSWIGAFQGMSAAQLADMANSLTGFELMGPEMHDYREAAVSRSNGRVGIVSFVKTSRGWVISQM